MRRVFGDTLSDEFVNAMVTQLILALRPGPHDVLDEQTLNAAIALIASVGPQSEMEALLAVEIAATAFTGLKFLKELKEHKAALRRVFGDTLSDEFVNAMVTQLILALRPGPHDVLDEQTLNAAIALIASVGPQSELEALLAVQIAATAFAGLKFLKHSQRHLDETFIGVYGGFATRLLATATRADPNARQAPARQQADR